MNLWNVTFRYPQIAVGAQVGEAIGHGGPMNTPSLGNLGLQISTTRTSRSMSAKVRAGELIRLTRGVYAPAQLSARELFVARAVALGATSSELVVSHRAAAALWGIPVVPQRLDVVELTSNADHGRAAKAGIKVHTSHLAEPDRRVLDCPGVPRLTVTTPARTALDLAAVAGFSTGVVAIEHLRSRGVSSDALAECRDRMGRREGGVRIAEALAFSGCGSESPGESLSRLRFREWPDIPQPEQQVRIRLQSGRTVRADFRWRSLTGPGLVGEFDGMDKYRDGVYAPVGEDVLLDEKDRHDALSNEGYVVIRWGWREVFSRPGDLRATILGGMRRAGIEPVGTYRSDYTSERRLRRDP